MTETAKEYLEELEFLEFPYQRYDQARVYTKVCPPRIVATFVGSGKLDEIKEFIDAEEIDIVVFDDRVLCTIPTTAER